MNDAFYEQIVPRKSRATDTVIRILTIAILAAILIFTMPLIGFIGIMITVVLAFGAYYLIFPKLNVEYEYTILNHDMQIDAIYSKSKRKSLHSFDIQQADIIAPKDSPRLHSYRADKTLDFSSGDGSHKIYAVMVPLGQKNTRILIEPDDKMLSHMKSWMGMKLYTD